MCKEGPYSYKGALTRRVRAHTLTDEIHINLFLIPGVTVRTNLCLESSPQSYKLALIHISIANWDLFSQGAGQITDSHVYMFKSYDIC
jgi:hypothetical protein